MAGKRAIKPGLLARLLAVALAAVTLSVLVDLPHSPDHWLSDFVTAHFSHRPEHQDGRIALLYIDDASLGPYTSPIDRGILARLVDIADAAGAKVIALDIIFDRRSEPDKDAELIRAIERSHARVVVGATMPSKGSQRAFQSEFLRSLGLNENCNRIVAEHGPTCGHVYLGSSRSSLVIDDSVIRGIEEVSNFESFGAAVGAAAGAEVHEQSSHISWLLQPSDRTDNFATMHASALLREGATSAALKRVLVDKIVLIGGDFEDRDKHLTPLSVGNDSLFTGTFIQAQYVSQILDGRRLNEVPPLFIILGLPLTALLAYFLGRRSGHYHLGLELIGIATLSVLSLILFFYLHLLFPYSFVVFFWLVGGAVGHYGNPVPSTEKPFAQPSDRASAPRSPNDGQAGSRPC